MTLTTWTLGSWAVEVPEATRSTSPTVAPPGLPAPEMAAVIPVRSHEAGAAEVLARARALFAEHPTFNVRDANPCGVTVSISDADRRNLGDLWLTPPAGTGGGPSKGFEVSIDQHTPDARAVESLVAAAHEAERRDDGELFAVATPWQCHNGVQVDPRLRLVAPLVALFAAILALLRRASITVDVRLPHALPASIQLTLFAYWWLYWPPVLGHARTVASQLALAYALDAAFSVARFGSWRVGLSLLPVVLSANLFAWLDVPGSMLFLVTAVGTKTLLRRGGKHVLNPSAAGLAVAGVATLLAPTTFRFTGVFHTINLAPNMAELVLLLALIAQARFPIVLVSIGAVVGLLVAAVQSVSVGPPLVLLAIALLATDPATIPRTPSGRLLFGVFIGLGTATASALLVRAGMPDDFAKVLAIPLANALVPLFDRLGAKVTWRALGPRYNLAHVAAWFLLVMIESPPKASSFEAALHWTWRTPLVSRDADDVPRCASNPVFCRPFSFFAEAAAWRMRRGSPPEAGTDARQDHRPTSVLMRPPSVFRSSAAIAGA